MRIIALGGSGGMGRAAVKVLASEYTVDEIVIADLNAGAAEEVAADLRLLGQRASPHMSKSPSLKRCSGFLTKPYSGLRAPLWAESCRQHCAKWLS